MGKRVNIVIDVTLHSKLRILCLQRNITLVTAITEAIELLTSQATPIPVNKVTTLSKVSNVTKLTPVSKVTDILPTPKLMPQAEIQQAIAEEKHIAKVMSKADAKPHAPTTSELIQAMIKTEHGKPDKVVQAKFPKPTKKGKSKKPEVQIVGLEEDEKFKNGLAKERGVINAEDYV